MVDMQSCYALHCPVSICLVLYCLLLHFFFANDVLKVCITCLLIYFARAAVFQCKKAPEELGMAGPFVRISI